MKRIQKEVPTDPKELKWYPDDFNAETTGYTFAWWHRDYLIRIVDTLTDLRTARVMDKTDIVFMPVPQIHMMNYCTGVLEFDYILSLLFQFGYSYFPQPYYNCKYRTNWPAVTLNDHYWNLLKEVVKDIYNECKNSCSLFEPEEVFKEMMYKVIRKSLTKEDVLCQLFKLQEKLTVRL